MVVLQQTQMDGGPVESGQCVRTAAVINDGYSQVHSGTDAVHLVVQDVEAVNAHLEMERAIENSILS